MAQAPFSTTGRIEGGKLQLRNRKRMAAALAQWRDGEVTITIERAHAHRSTAANALYWGVFVAAASEDSGYSPNEIHELLKAHCLPHELAETGENGRLVNGLVIGGSTARLNRLQFSDYLKSCAQFVAETWGTVIPESQREVA
jgi:hypothetical protein